MKCWKLYLFRSNCWALAYELVIIIEEGISYIHGYNGLKLQAELEKHVLFHSDFGASYFETHNWRCYYKECPFLYTDRNLGNEMLT